MRLGYFTMPVHPMHRSWVETLKEDREAIILADQLGFHDAFMGEHLTDVCENITNSMMFQASLIPATKRIKLATGTSNLTQMHPVLIAVQAAMFDHLAEGRFILGVSPGALTSDAEALGILDEDRNKMFAEAIDVIIAIWERDPPYDIAFPDNRYKVSTARTMTLDLGKDGTATLTQSPDATSEITSFAHWTIEGDTLKLIFDPVEKQPTPSTITFRYAHKTLTPVIYNHDLWRTLPPPPLKFQKQHDVNGAY